MRHWGHIPASLGAHRADDAVMIFAEAIQFTPEQERALFAALLALLALFLVFVIGFVLSIVAGVRCGADGSRTRARAYWLLWIAIEGVLGVAAVASGEPVSMAVVATMLAMTAGAERFGALVLRRGGVSRDPSTLAASRPGSPDPGGPGSRP